ncbi:MAG: MFS transporter [Pseudomonadota bacterium]
MACHLENDQDLRLASSASVPSGAYTPRTMATPFTASALQPLTTVFVIQVLMTMAAYGIAVLVPEAAADIGIAPESVGFLTATLYFTAMPTGLLSAFIINRLGATRTFQLLLLFIGLGGVSLMAAHPLLAYLGAALIGAGTGPMNPTGSHVLLRTAPDNWKPLFFSLKQCGTPAGGILAGAALPALAVLYDWRVALALLPVGALMLIALAPLGQLGGRERPGESSRNETDVLASIRLALSTRERASVAVLGAIMGACQLAMASYFVVYLVSHVGLDVVKAGGVFVVFHVSGIVARVLLGVLAERALSTQALLALLAFIMASAIALLTQFETTPNWWLIYATTAALGVSANGWVGLFFAEVARLAPSGQAVFVTGGAQFIMYIGIVLGPVIFGTLLTATGNYDVCFALFASLAVVCGLLVVSAQRPARV